jgi:ATPase subunit of ABC transporter with duplicated ATPase domains
MIYSGCNVLILDEPTRNLSPLSAPAVRKLLRDFKGAVICVSHDRKFISEVCDKVYRLGDNGLIMTSG